MVNYENSKIYKIVCNVTGLCYIGSTCEPTLARRLSKHVGNYKNYKNGKFHNLTSFKVLENDDYDIILLEKVKNCTSKEQLYARERYHIETNECVNRIVVGRTQKEYYEDNKETVHEKYKEYYEDNKDKIKNKVKEYRDENKEKIYEKHVCQCGGCYTTYKKTQHEKTIKHKQYIQLETLKDCLTKNLSFSEIKKILEAL